MSYEHTTAKRTYVTGRLCAPPCVLAFLSINKTTFYAGIRTGTFPAPLKLRGWCSTPCGRRPVKPRGQVRASLFFARTAQASRYNSDHNTFFEMCCRPTGVEYLYILNWNMLCSRIFKNSYCLLDVKSVFDICISIYSSATP